ncbi:MAG: hypothetical protein UT14_C0033G0003 [Candidatus Shapirobacteria bacterium GW2011_GWE1_38_92]|uniref:Uncharacterized protein n=1 Tax=Candidatus Shapirobacteria bacterium GW2011_GWE1_38_92 TaxID=1618489 RepID=A0A0G0LFJ1_9BACT|nr:MAG: hypothetical protein UT14_C0033G0003 [Candidatus Shapirobacteria bacterium GW2011_GWE1_38_92]
MIGRWICWILRFGEGTGRIESKEGLDRGGGIG